MKASKTLKDAKYTELYCSMATEARKFGETNDCAVKAIAMVTGKTYAEAHAALAAQGRKNGKGTYDNQTRGAVESLGFICREVQPRSFIDRYPSPHNNLRSVTTHHPARFNEVWADGKRYLLVTARHILAVLNGQNHDYTVGMSSRVRYMYEVQPKAIALKQIAEAAKSQLLGTK